MHKLFFIISIFLISCDSVQQKVQAQDFSNLLQSRAEVVKSYSDSIRYYMDTLLNNAGFSGGILVAKNDSVLYEHYQGSYDAAQKMAINDSTPFHVASTSKTFTSHAILQLMRQSKLDLTDTLQQFFPDFPYRGITVKHLLTHTSGLQDYVVFFPKFRWNKKQIATNNDVLKWMISKKPRLANPIGKFVYCNTNYALLALIVEKVTGKKFPDYVKEYIFKPAGMKHSFILNITNKYRYLPSFHSNKKIYDFNYLDAIYGDKNVYTTCRDLMRYDSAIRHYTLLDSAAYEMAWEPLQFDSHYSESDSIEHYGLGWRLKVWPNGNKIVYHNGWWHGNNSIFQRVYQDTVVIVVMGNIFNRRIYSAPHVANYFRLYYQQSNTEERSDMNLNTANSDVNPTIKTNLSIPVKK